LFSYLVTSFDFEILEDIKLIVFLLILEILVIYFCIFRSSFVFSGRISAFCCRAYHTWERENKLTFIRLQVKVRGNLFS